MKPPRNDDFAQRRKAASDAKKALLEKLKAGKKGDTAKTGGKPDTGKRG